MLVTNTFLSVMNKKISTLTLCYSLYVSAGTLWTPLWTVPNTSLTTWCPFWSRLILSYITSCWGKVGLTTCSTFNRFEWFDTFSSHKIRKLTGNLLLAFFTFFELQTVDSWEKPVERCSVALPRGCSLENTLFTHAVCNTNIKVLLWKCVGK